MSEAFDVIRLSIILGVTLVAAVSLWILGIRMRRRITRALGIKVTNESELTSLSMWMKVQDAEERSKGEKLQ
jgi:hypothetical protein